MSIFPRGRIGLIAGAFFALSACDDAQFDGLFGGSTGAAVEETTDAEPRASGQVRVVEAPDIFDESDTALWDGRPSLGLIWVAYEGADPTNVIIRNEENGAFVVGALYRRERFFPGPPFQLSSDAAAELGILAGNPTSIRVTALREEAVEPEPEVIAIEDPTVEEEAPLEMAETEIMPAPMEDKPDEIADTISAAAAAIEVADPTPTLEAIVPVVVARRPTTEGPNAPIPRIIPATEETTDIAPVAPTLPVPVAVGEPIENPIAPPGEGVTTLEKPFIQVGIFSVQENAESVANGLTGIGIIPFVEEQRVGGRDFYRVVVGPASNANERADLLEKIKAQGFDDAYFVKN